MTKPSPNWPGGGASWALSCGGNQPAERCVAPGAFALTVAAMPELPRAMAERLVHEHGLPEYDAATLTQSKAMAAYFLAAVAAGGGTAAASRKKRRMDIGLSRPRTFLSFTMP